jgi:vitamin B12 transporter
LHASGGRAFVAPDPFGRAGLSVQPITGGANLTVGNPTLAPERSTTIDGGVSFTSSSGAFESDVTYFTTDVRDRNVTARATFTGTQRPRLADGTIVNRVDTRVNAGDAQIRGLELSARYDVLRAKGSTRSLSLFSNGTRFFRARERSPVVTVDGARFANQANFDPASVFTAAQFGNAVVADIRNVANLTLSTGIEYDDNRRFSLSTTGRYVGHRLDTDFSDLADVSDIRYPRYITVDMVAGLRFAQRMRLMATVANLTDENFYEKRGFNMAGRTYTIRLSTRF